MWWLLLLTFSDGTTVADSKEFDFRDCGVRYDNNRYVPVISHGSSTSYAQFPWHVAIFRQESPGDIPLYYCGGSIIHPQLVLTAAHCIFDEINSNVDTATYIVAAGKYNRSWDHIDSHERRFKVVDIKVPKTYLGFKNRLADDIALLVLNESISFDSVIRPVCVDWSSESSNQGYGIGSIAGWGYTENKNLSDALLTAKLRYYNFTTCRDKVSLDFVNFLTSDKFCAASDDAASVEIGDSGGGLVLTQKTGKGGEQFFIYGVLSGKDVKIKKMAAFSHVGSHLKWMNESIRNIMEGFRKKTACGKIHQFNYTGVDGNTSTVPGYTWLASIYDFRFGGVEFNCVGSIIHPKAILTVADCVYDQFEMKYLNITAVAVGKYNRDWNIQEPNEKRYKIAKIHKYEFYIGYGSLKANDIAILELKEEIVFNEAIMPVCLDWENKLKLYNQPSPLGMVVGIKYTKCDECWFPEAGYYRYTKYSECKKLIEELKISSRIYMTPDKICGDYVNGTRLQHTYGGSFTLPLVNSNSEEEHYLYGVHTYNNPEILSTYTNAMVKLSWIEKVVKSIP